MDKLLELEKKLREAKEALEKGKLLPKPKATNIPEKKVTEYGPKVGIHSGNTLSPDKDSGDHDYDYAVNHKTGEVHKKLLEGPHKDMYVPMGHDENNKPIKKSLDERVDDLLKNSMMGYDTVNGSFAQSEKHDDEKEDKRLIAEAIDVHNEKKHDEDKDKNSAFKDMKIKKEEGDVIKMEAISFAKNGQWSLEKAKINKPNISSENTDASLNPHIGGKTGKIHGGNPRKPTGELENAFIESKNGKMTQRVSGASSKRAGQRDESGNKLEKSVDEILDGILETLNKGLGSKLDNAEHKAKVSQALGSIRQPAKVTNAAGETKMVSPEEQVSNAKSVKANKAAEAKAKAEAEAAERRASYKK